MLINLPFVELTDHSIALKSNSKIIYVSRSHYIRDKVTIKVLSLTLFSRPLSISLLDLPQSPLKSLNS